MEPDTEFFQAADVKASVSQAIGHTMSRNFSVLKLAAILMVFSGHYLSDHFGMIWVPTTVALLIFSYSSGMFTEMKYQAGFSAKYFFINKVRRLGISLFVIEIVLLGLFLIQGREGIWTWQTMVNVVGLNGFLNWFRIPNPSPYGRAMWFLTLLIIFYLCYPLLRSISRRWFYNFSIGFVICCFIMDRIAPVGHQLWLTACGFIAGILVVKSGFNIPQKWSIAGCIVSFILMTVLTLIFRINILTFFLLLAFSVCFIFTVQDLSVKDVYIDPVKPFTGCVP